MATGSGKLSVELVAADRKVWSGEATMVIARTVEGDVGVLRGHAPMLSLLTDAVVEIDPDDAPVVIATVDGGFLSVADNHVSILSEQVLLAHEINIDDARAEVEVARGLLDQADDAEHRLRRAEVRLRAAEKAEAQAKAV